jgi:hypothetical protein
LVSLPSLGSSVITDSRWDGGKLPVYKLCFHALRWLDPWTSSISYIPFMECRLGQGMILCKMTAPLELLSGLSHCQEI